VYATVRCPSVFIVVNQRKVKLLADNVTPYTDQQMLSAVYIFVCVCVFQWFARIRISGVMLNRAGRQAGAITLNTPLSYVKIARQCAKCAHRVRYSNSAIIRCSLFRGYYTAVFISTSISRSSVDYQPEATAEG